METDERTTKLCHLIYLIVSSIADDVGSIAIEPVLTSDRRILILAQVSESNRGKLIGRDGPVADAIRHYVEAYQLQHGGAYEFDIRGKPPQCYALVPAQGTPDQGRQDHVIRFPLRVDR